MSEFIQVSIDGLAAGAVYASLALALVIIYRCTKVMNFAQGEMGMFAAYVAWALNAEGLPLGLAIVAALTVSALIGIVLHMTLIRPTEGASELTVVILTLGVFLMLNGVASWIWGSTIRSLPSIFPDDVLELGSVRLSVESLGLIGVLVAEVVVLWLLLQRTRLGLAMRAAADAPVASRLQGVPVARMHMLGWGLAAILGALSGILIAPNLGLEPHYMFGVMIYAFAAALVGGLDSPGGAVVGGLVIGFSENVVGTYVPFLGSDLQMVVALFIVLAVVVTRPNGLFGRAEVARV